MATATASARRASGRTRLALRERLQERRTEIEQAALTRVRAIAAPGEVSDPAYAEGLRAAVSAAVGYGIEATGREASDLPIPVALLAQARIAARAGIPLDTVLRRYFAGYSLLGHFILEEAANAGITDGDELKRLVGAHAGLFDRLLEAVGEEYGREGSVRRDSSERRQAERIERLLAGELIDTAELNYGVTGWHLGAAIGGWDEAGQVLRDLASQHDWRLLLLPRDETATWAWLGTGRRLEPTALSDLLSGSLPDDCYCALGEPGENLAGWRLTHHQAVAALGVAQRGPERLVRYGDVAVLAAALRDDLLGDSLRCLYLDPLVNERDGGATLRATLSAYFGHERNSASAAATLGVSRQTVNYRLRLIEQRIGRRLGVCAGELEVALHLPYR